MGNLYKMFNVQQKLGKHWRNKKQNLSHNLQNHTTCFYCTLLRIEFMHQIFISSNKTAKFSSKESTTKLSFSVEQYFWNISFCHAKTFPEEVGCFQQQNVISEINFKQRSRKQLPSKHIQQCCKRIGPRLVSKIKQVSKIPFNKTTQSRKWALSSTRTASKCIAICAALSKTLCKRKTQQ